MFNQNRPPIININLCEKSKSTKKRKSIKKKGVKFNIKILLIVLIVLYWSQPNLKWVGQILAKNTENYWATRNHQIELGNKYARRTYGNKRQHGIKIIHFNKGNGHLCNKMREIENVVDGYHPHIMGISESNFMKNHNVEKVHIPNYKFIPAKTLSNPNLNVSRVAVYMHDSLVGKVRNDLMDDNFSSIWLEVGLPRKKKILICQVYREFQYLHQVDHSSRRVSEQLARWLIFLDQWERGIAEGKECVVLGDMNLNHQNWTRQDLPSSDQSVTFKPLISALFNKILPHGVSQLINVPTRSQGCQSQSGLDHLYTNRPDKLSPAQVINWGGSDHKMIFVTRYSKSIRSNARYITKRCYKDFNSQEFLNAVKAISWVSLYECYDVNQALKILCESLTNILDQMAPVQTIQVRQKYAPWLSTQTKVLINERNSAQKLAFETKKQADWDNYRKLRNQINNRLKKEKQSWQKAKLENCENENNSAKIWGNIKTWLNWSSAGSPTQLFVDGKLESRPKGIAEAMNQYFIGKVRNLRNNIPSSRSDPVGKLKILLKNRKCSFSLKTVSPETVSKILTNLRNAKSVGLDQIDTNIIKLVKNEILPSLTHIINLSIQQSTFPANFKIAKVVPLFKKDDKLDPKNYRPVAILPIFSKILERVIYLQVTEYFELNGLLHPNHHGYRSNHNTTTALLQMYDSWVEASDRGEYSSVCFLDLSAAFDVVDHDLLLKKLAIYGFDEKSVNWMESYLRGRKQVVCVDGCLSSKLEIEAGVPQGSILGPLMYIIFTNELPEIIHEHPPNPIHQPVDSSFDQNCDSCGSICCYADDSTFSYAGQDSIELSNLTADKYEKMADYMTSNKLKLNGDKTHLMVMMNDAARRKNPNFQIQLDTGEKIVETSETEKLLGAQISQNLKWNQHIRDDEKSLIKSLNTRLNAFKKVSRIASFKTRKMIGNGIFISKLIYLIPLWSGCQDELLNSLQVIMNKAAKAIARSPEVLSSREALRQVGWLSVRQLAAYHTITMMYKIINTKSPSYMYKKLSSSFPYKTRFATNQNIRMGPDFQANHSLTQVSFRWRGSQLWNNLPSEVKGIGNLGKFKNKAKNWVLDNIAF